MTRKIVTRPGEKLMLKLAQRHIGVEYRFWGELLTVT
jgi:hypothetical protein